MTHVRTSPYYPQSNLASVKSMAECSREEDRQAVLPIVLDAQRVLGFADVIDAIRGIAYEQVRPYPAHQPSDR